MLSLRGQRTSLMWRYECRVSGGLRAVPERDSAHSLVHQQAGTLWGVCGWTQAVSHKHAGVMWSCFKQIWLISPQHSLWLNLVFFGIIMIWKGWKLRQEKRGRNMLCSGLFKLGLINCDWKIQYNYNLRSGMSSFPTFSRECTHIQLCTGAG